MMFGTSILGQDLFPQRGRPRGEGREIGGRSPKSRCDSQRPRRVGSKKERWLAHVEIGVRFGYSDSESILKLHQATNVSTVNANLPNRGFITLYLYGFIRI